MAENIKHCFRIPVLKQCFISASGDVMIFVLRRMGVDWRVEEGGMAAYPSSTTWKM